MRVVSTTFAIRPKSKASRHPVLERILRALVPAANPDYEKLYPDVRLWWVEVNDAGVPQRELGFGGDGRALVAGPLGENMGFWTDSSMVFLEGAGNEQVPSQAFEAAWDGFLNLRGKRDASESHA